MKVLIIDDEIDARHFLKQTILAHFLEIIHISEAASVKEAVAVLTQDVYDLVFLDIEMPNENGFALFEYFPNPTFKTIFCTAYSQYAIQAFEVSAMDYLLKPVSIEKLKLAIQKVISIQNKEEQQLKIGILRDNFQQPKNQKIVISSNEGLSFVKLEDILYFEAYGSYTKVITLQDTHLVTKKLKEYESLLLSYPDFFRTHRSFIVNISKIVKYNRLEGLVLEQLPKLFLPVGKEKKTELEEILKNISIS